MEDRPDNRTAAIALNLIPGFGPRAFMRAVGAFGELGELFGADRRKLAACGLAAEAASSVRRARPAELAGAESERAARCGARMVTWFDDGYPQGLRHLHDPPPVLYVRGPLDLNRGVAVAVVGSRKPTHYGIQTAEILGRELSAAGCNVVSGLAAGIDTAAHRGALEGGGITTAVYGCGLDIIYPAANRGLAGKIAASGACVSEFPLGTRPEKHTFPRRNRVISGLSQACVVVEAGARSGALITADFALDQGRDVWAVPGRVG
jgi:DNA processing protein